MAKKNLQSLVRFVAVANRHIVTGTERKDYAMDQAMAILSSARHSGSNEPPDAGMRPHRCGHRATARTAIRAGRLGRSTGVRYRRDLAYGARGSRETCAPRFIRIAGLVAGSRPWRPVSQSSPRTATNERRRPDCPRT
jgi:hypothetical protein